MTRLFLAAGVAALAMSAPAYADKGGGGHGGGGGRGGQAAPVNQGGGGEGAAVFRGGGGGRGHGEGGGAAVFMGGGGGGRGHGGGFGGFAVQRQSFERHGGGGHLAAPRMERSERFATFDRGGRGHGGERFAVADRGGRGHGGERAAMRANRMERIQSRGFERQQARGFERGQLRGNRPQRVEDRFAARNELRGNRGARVENEFVSPERLGDNGAIGIREARNGFAGARGFGVGGCPPGLMSKGCMPPGQALNANRIASTEAFRASTLAALTLGERSSILDPFAVSRFVGSPLSAVTGVSPLMAFPSSVSYLYPDTPDYYYRYGNGYLYQVDRGTNVIASLLPLLGGGFMPGSYLPNYYMSSYVPDAYGFNSFYPDYGNNCYRYGNGVIYDVDCFTGLVQDVIPMYAGGYGVGQLLPSSYGYYNVPSQYRSLYYNTPDYNYWYAPGAIYQYDRGTSLITSVAALLSPGFTIGQPLPLGYSAYNVPYDYRSTYYDTPTAWYRYNNGYIYQVDPVTQLVTSIVASILT